jgi:hypothetical protein
MPLDVRVDHERRLIFVDGVGAVTDQDLLTYVDEYLSEEELRTYDELFDLTDSDLLDLTYQGLASVASAAAATDPDAEPTRIAILVSETLGLGLSRMYQSLREVKGGRRQTRVFQDEAECHEWLGISP